MQIKMFAPILCLLFTSTVFAKTVSAPFFAKHVPIEGLTVEYDMTGRYPQKITCVLDDFNKGGIAYTENNKLVVADMVFGDGDDSVQFYFTNKGQTWAKSQSKDSLYQFHADAKGYLVIDNTRSYESPAKVTCLYQPE